jgi:hypothetical protein
MGAAVLSETPGIAGSLALKSCCLPPFFRSMTRFFGIGGYLSFPQSGSSWELKYPMSLKGKDDPS